MIFNQLIAEQWNSTSDGPIRNQQSSTPCEQEMVMMRKSDLLELLKLPAEVKKLKDRLNIAERTLKRAHGEGGRNSMAKRIRLESLPSKLNTLAHLKNPRYFFNWWAKGASHISPERAIPELINMGFPREALEKLDGRHLSEMYCLVMRLLFSHGALEELPRHVPRCYQRQGLEEKYVHEKMRIIDPVL